MASLRLGSMMHMPSGLAVDLGHEGDVRVEDQLHVLGHLLHLVGKRRDDAPLVGPGVVVDVHDVVELALHLRRVDGAELHLGERLDVLPGLEHAIGERADRRRSASRRDPSPSRSRSASMSSRLVRARVRHHQVRRVLEALDEAADLVVRVERAAGRGCASCRCALQPLLGRGRSAPWRPPRRRSCRRSRRSPCRPSRAQVLAVDRRRAAPDEAAVLPRGEERDLGAVEERVVLRVEALLELEVERRDPRRVVAKDLVARRG